MDQNRWGDVEPTLAQLGVEEVRERLEVTPLLATGGGEQGVDGCDCHCDCSIPKPTPVQDYDRLFR